MGPLLSDSTLRWGGSLLWSSEVESGGDGPSVESCGDSPGVESGGDSPGVCTTGVSTPVNKMRAYDEGL